MGQTEIEIGGVHYRLDRLDAFKQFHVSRKLAPMLPKLVPVFVKLKAGSVGDDLAGLAEAAAPFADALAAMPEADADYVLKTCLSVVRREQNGAWPPLMSDGSLMFHETGLDTVLPLVVRVIRENLGNFTQGLLANAPATSAPPVGT